MNGLEWSKYNQPDRNPYLISFLFQVIIQAKFHVYGCAYSISGIYGKISIQKINPLFDSRQARASTILPVFHFKSDAIILNRYLQAVFRFVKLDNSMLCPGMF